MNPADGAKAYYARVQAAFKAMEDAKSTLKDELSKLRAVCDHPEVYECEYWQGHFTSVPPTRICTTCRIMEEGWGAGFQVLKHSDRIIERQELYDMRYPIGDSMYGWCYGNRTYQGHPAPKSQLKFSNGTRCCEEHAV